MAKKRVAKKQKRRIGPRRRLPKSVAAYVKTGLRAVRFAKQKMEVSAPGMRAAWRELHHVESRLSRLA